LFFFDNLLLKVIPKTIDSGSAASRKAMLPEDRKELVAGKEVIGEDGIFKLLSMAIFAR
jgi:hypothetical protein